MSSTGDEMEVEVSIDIKWGEILVDIIDYRSRGMSLQEIQSKMEQTQREYITICE